MHEKPDKNLVYFCHAFRIQTFISLHFFFSSTMFEIAKKCKHCELE